MPQTCHFKRFTNDHDLKPTNCLTYALHYVCMEKILSQWYTYRDTADKIISRKARVPSKLPTICSVNVFMRFFTCMLFIGYSVSLSESQ